MNGLRLVLYNNTHTLCVCVCVCVCLTWDIWNGRSYRHAAYTILKSFAWRVAQTAFRAYMTSGSREKAYERFSPVTCQFPYMHRYTSGYPRQDESCPLQQSCWNILKGYTLKDMPSISWILRLPRAGWILPATRTALERSRRLHVRTRSPHYWYHSRYCFLHARGYSNFTWTGYRSFAKYEY